MRFDQLEYSQILKDPSSLGGTMNWFQRFYWTKLSKPAAERPLCDFLLKTKITSVLQLGMGDGALTKKVLHLARVTSSDSPVRFAGVDPFESAVEPRSHMRLKEAHRLCAELGVKAHLIPGELKNALPRVAVTILPSDLVIVAAQFSDQIDELLKGWLPRLVHGSSTLFVASGTSGKFERHVIPAYAQSRQAA